MKGDFGLKVLAKIYVTLKTSVLDPQGTAVLHALHALGFGGVLDVRVGKYLEVVLEAEDDAAARRQVERMCNDLLTNPVIETFTYEFAEVRT